MANAHDDPHRDTASLFEVTHPRLVPWDGGLSAEFNTRVSYKDLDEDRDGGDKVYARVLLYDPRYERPRIHSGIITGNDGGCRTSTGGGKVFLVLSQRFEQKEIFCG